MTNLNKDTNNFNNDIEYDIDQQLPPMGEQAQGNQGDLNNMAPNMAPNMAQMPMNPDMAPMGQGWNGQNMGGQPMNPNMAPMAPMGVQPNKVSFMDKFNSFTSKIDNALNNLVNKGNLGGSQGMNPGAAGLEGLGCLNSDRNAGLDREYNGELGAKDVFTPDKLVHDRPAEPPMGAPMEQNIPPMEAPVQPQEIQNSPNQNSGVSLKKGS